jgi:hypothetical protein
VASSGSYTTRATTTTTTTTTQTHSGNRRPGATPTIYTSTIYTGKTP